MAKKPILYYVPPSPPCCSVLLAAAYLGIDLDLRLMDLKAGDHLTPEFLQLNHLHTIPVLDDNGLVITDSHVICSYLADKYATDEHLYPKDKNDRMQVDTLLHFDSSHLYPRARLIVEPVIFFGADEISQQSVAYMQRAYDGLDRALASKNFVCGDNMTIADLCCVATVTAAMPFAPIEEEKFPNVSSWIQRFSELPFYTKLYQDGAHVLHNFVMGKLEENRNLRKLS